MNDTGRTDSSGPPAPCPECGSSDVVHLVYGLVVPTGDGGLKPWEQPAGCSIIGNPPTRLCNECGADWGHLVATSHPPVSRPTTQFRPKLRKQATPKPPDHLEDRNSLLRHADVPDLNSLEAWVDSHMELDVHLLTCDDASEHPECIVVQIHTRGVDIEFPTTVSDFWETILELEEEVIAELEAADD